MTVDIDERVAREVLQAAHAAWSNGDIEGVLRHCTDDLAYRCNALGPGGSALEIKGKRAFGNFLKSLAAAVESVSVAECFQLSNGLGLARIDWYLQHRQSGLVLSSSSRQIAAYRGERICDVRDCHDAAKLAAFWHLSDKYDADSTTPAVFDADQTSVDTIDLHCPTPGPYGPTARNIAPVDTQRMAMQFSQRERIALFIDGANLYAAAKALGFDIDYKRLLEVFRGKGQLVRAFYYTAIAEDQEYSSIRPLVDWLDYNGFSMVTKPAKDFTDTGGRRRVKGNMDVELAVDAMRMAVALDHIVIFSGDGDFRSLVEALQQIGKRVSVVSSLQTQPPMVADELRRQADQFIDLYDLGPAICRSDAAVRTPQGRA
jgi:uncharacterized LabA/DUF88 family protein